MFAIDNAIFTSYLRYNRRFACPLMYPHVRLTILTVDRSRGYILLRCHRKSRGLSLQTHRPKSRLPARHQQCYSHSLVSLRRCSLPLVARKLKGEFNVNFRILTMKQRYKHVQWDYKRRSVSRTRHVDVPTWK